MSADLLNTGAVLTAEQQLARYAYALREAHQAKRLTLDNFTPASVEPYITISEGFYQYATTTIKQHLIIVATLPIDISGLQQARKPWLNVQQWGTETLAAAYGVS